MRCLDVLVHPLMITGLVRRLHSPTTDLLTMPHTLATVLTVEHDRHQDRHRPESGDRRGRYAPSAGTGGTSRTTGPNSAQVCVTVGTGMVHIRKIVYDSVCWPECWARA